jgi:hypothetical protein
MAGDTTAETKVDSLMWFNNANGTWNKHSREDGLVVEATFRGHPDHPI